MSDAAREPRDGRARRSSAWLPQRRGAPNASCPGTRSARRPFDAQAARRPPRCARRRLAERSRGSSGDAERALPAAAPSASERGRGVTQGGPLAKVPSLARPRPAPPRTTRTTREQRVRRKRLAMTTRGRSPQARLPVPGLGSGPEPAAGEAQGPAQAPVSELARRPGERETARERVRGQERMPGREPEREPGLRWAAEHSFGEGGTADRRSRFRLRRGCPGARTARRAPTRRTGPRLRSRPPH
jgi:hypothetical protein